MATNLNRFKANKGLDNNSNTITNVADPVNAQDAATKAFSSNASNIASGTLGVANGGTGLTTFTNSGIVYASSTSALTTGSSLTFDGTTLTTSITSGVGLLVTGTGSVGARITGGSGVAGGSYLSLQAQGGNAALVGTEAAILGSGTSTNLMLYGYGSNSIVIAPATAEVARFTSTGLGIGTTSPAYKLDVSGTSHFSDAIGVGTNPNQYGGRIDIYTNADTVNNGIWVRNDSVGSSAKAGIVLNASGNSWRMSMGSTANNSNALIWESDVVSPTTRMTLDISGNLGLGVTPSAWRSGDRSLDIGGTTSLANIQGIATRLYHNAYIDSGSTIRYKISSFASVFAQNESGQFTWSTAPSGTAGNAITFTQAMTLDASGLLGIGRPTNTNCRTIIRGIGTTSATSGLVVENSVGTEYFNLNDAGNLGIGTSSPQSGLHINKPFGSQLRIQETNGTFFDITGGGRLDIRNNAGDAIVSIAQSGSPVGTHLNLDSSGNLGIGTSSPGTKLDIRGGSEGSNFSAISIDNSAAGAGTNTVSINFSNGGAVKNSITGAVYGNGYLAFATDNNTEKMRLTAGGNLGIGTASPSYKLDVSGRGRVNEAGTGNGAGGIIAGTASADGNAGVLFETNATSRWNITTTGTAGANLRIYNHSLAATVATFDSSGRLGIGTASPNAKLTVSGNSSSNTVPDIQITRSSSGSTIQTGPNITFGDGTTNNTVALQATQGRFGIWNYGGGSWAERLSVASTGAIGIGGENYGTSGQVLTSNGSGAAPSWQTASGALPSQTGNSGKYLTTNGTTASWASINSGAPVTKTSDFTLGDTENWVIVNKAGTCYVTLPAASSWTGRQVTFKTLNDSVYSASSNVVPRTSATPGTAIVVNGIAGAWTTLVSDGTNWVAMAGGN